MIEKEEFKIYLDALKQKKEKLLNKITELEIKEFESSEIESLKDKSCNNIENIIEQLYEEIYIIDEIINFNTSVSLFKLTDIYKVLSYIISVIENKEFNVLLENFGYSIEKQNLNPNTLSPFLYTIENGNMVYYDFKDFPYINDFFNMLSTVKKEKNKKFGYPKDQIYTYEELYVLANEFIDKYLTNNKTLIKKIVN